MHWNEWCASGCNLSCRLPHTHQPPADPLPRHAPLLLAAGTRRRTTAWCRERRRGDPTCPCRPSSCPTARATRMPPGLCASRRGRGCAHRWARRGTRSSSPSWRRPRSRPHPRPRRRLPSAFARSTTRGTTRTAPRRWCSGTSTRSAGRRPSAAPVGACAAWRTVSARPRRRCRRRSSRAPRTLPSPTTRTRTPRTPLRPR
jgi:hypothetical protein